MNKWLREFRIIPVVLIATGCLFALKAIGLMFDGGYSLGQRLARTDTLTVTTVPVTGSTVLRSQSTPLEVASSQPGGSKQSWMQEMFNYPDVTGSVSAPKPAAPEPAKKGEAGPVNPSPQTRPAGTTIALDGPRAASVSERAILERLQERRQELDSRARELDLRESLLKAAEKKLEAKQTDQKDSDTRGPSGARKEDAEAARFKGLVTMYETMKPKEAAKIFDRLDIRVLMDVASQISPRRMSEILAQMTPEAAERLTVELAARAGGPDRAMNPNDLPKIEGRPSGG